MQRMKGILSISVLLVLLVGTGRVMANNELLQQGQYVFFAAGWYEIDTLADLDEAEKLFGIPCPTAGRSLVAIEPLPSLA
jgi:hypothetical protein